ncbi:MAG: hypothetical protein JNL69_11770, partial [Bacteroidia bacterium]|nr:hypothetical protein [Bacteroidia bacterium]
MNKFKLKTLFSFFIVILALTSCENFIETDLANKSIHVLSPIDNYVSPNFSITFWWNKVEGAEGYELQIVRPNFAIIQQLVLDTTIISNQFSYSLHPGVYQWRIKAKNSTSSTNYQVYNLSIDSSLNLANQSVITILPTDNSYSNTY